jgi:hypothetical protein
MRRSLGRSFVGGLVLVVDERTYDTLEVVVLIMYNIFENGLADLAHYCNHCRNKHGSLHGASWPSFLRLFSGFCSIKRDFVIFANVSLDFETSQPTKSRIRRQWQTRQASFL